MLHFRAVHQVLAFQSVHLLPSPPGRQRVGPLFSTLSYVSGHTNYRPQMRVWCATAGTTWSLLQISRPSIVQDKCRIFNEDQFVFMVRMTLTGAIVTQGLDINNDFDVDLAQGPSIQTACEGHNSRFTSCLMPLIILLFSMVMRRPVILLLLPMGISGYSNHLSFSSGLVVGSVLRWKG